VDLRSLRTDLNRPQRAVSRGWLIAPRWPRRRAGSGSGSSHRYAVSPPGARQHGGDTRPDLTRRLELGLGAVGTPTRPMPTGSTFSASRSDGSLRRGLRRHRRAAHPGTLLLFRHLLHPGRGYCEPKPVQRPPPPICIGGSGERRTLRTVARIAQHWNYWVDPSINMCA